MFGLSYWHWRSRLAYGLHWMLGPSILRLAHERDRDRWHRVACMDPDCEPCNAYYTDYLLPHQVAPRR